MLRTERLVVEPLAHEHAEGLVAALGDERVGEFIGGPDVTTVDALHERIDRLADGPGPDRPHEHWHQWVVRRAADRVIVGRLEATTYGADRAAGEWAEIAYVFGPAHWGHGLATEAAAWLLAHLASVFGVTECWAAVHPDNARSVALLARLGFERRDEPGRPMGSFDPGDLVFVRASPAT